MSTQHEPNERTGAVRNLLIETVERGGISSPRSRRGPWIAAAAVGAGAVVVASVLAVGALTAPVSPSTVGTGEGSSTSSGSRVKLYASLEELIADSAAIVSGTVLDGEPTQDLSGYTTWTVRVDGVYSPKALSSATGGTPVSVEVGDEVLVRHLGGSDAVSPGGGVVVPAQRYLLFLTPTGLPDAAEEFYIVGAGAGAYIADGDGFRRLVTDADSLPASLTPADLGS